MKIKDAKKSEPVSDKEAEDAVRTLLRYIGEDPEREGLIQTPQRVVASFEDLYSGYNQKPEIILGKTYRTKSSEMVVLKNTEFYSVCEHHMLPFQGVCHIAYIPDSRIVGFSSLVALIETYARRLQIQEELTSQIAESLMKTLEPKGVGVIINAAHMCMSCQGVKKKNSEVITSAMCGTFKNNDTLRGDFFRHFADN